MRAGSSKYCIMGAEWEGSRLVEESIVTDSSGGRSSGDSL